MEGNKSAGSNTGKYVSQNDVCELFCKRTAILPLEKCYFCRYADFGLTGDEYNEQGICQYPKKQIV